jgi:hypothetical protein
MKPRIESWSLVLNGSWNPAILNPNWSTAHLGFTGQFHIEIAVNDPRLPPRYTCDGIRMVTAEDRMILAPLADDPAALQRMGDVAIRVLEILTHTPITAVGINFEFEVADPPPFVRSLLRSQDENKIAAADFVINQRELRRRVCRGDTLVSWRFKQPTDADLLIHVNFHRSVDGAIAAANYLRQEQVIRSREFALRFLKDIYALELGEGDFNG